MLTWLQRTYESPWMPTARFVLRWVCISQILGIATYVALRTWA
jgi:hypothetical protein